MSLRIRLRRMGRKKAPHYRIVVAESTMPRDGRFVATVGHYNPTTNPATLKVDSAKAAAWLAKGAVPTNTVRSLLHKAGITDIVVEYQGNVAETGASAAYTTVKRITLGDADKDEARGSVALTEELLAHLDSIDDSPDEIVSLLGLAVEDIDRVTEYFSRYLDPEDRDALISLRIAAERHVRVHDRSPEVLPDSVVPSPASSGAYV